MAHVAKWKHGEVSEITNLLTSNKVIGIVEIGGIPGPQMQKTRKNLQKNAVVRSAKNTLIIKALDEAEIKVKGISALKDNVKGQAAIIATDMNPFKLFGQIKATRTMTPAKGGETAPSDISVNSGETNFKPGPIVGELQKVGIPAAIQDGKVVIKTDKVLVPAGQKIPADVAQMITRLEIYPIEVGMTLHGVYEDGKIFGPDVLDINIDQFKIRLQQASNYAFNLAIESAWVNKTTVTPLLQKAHRDAFALAMEKNIITKETVKNLLSKAHRNMVVVASRAQQEALDEDLKKMIT